MNRTAGSLLFGSLTVALLELSSISTPASAGWFWKGKCKPACHDTEQEQCASTPPTAPPTAPPETPPLMPPMTPQAPAVFQTPQATSDVSGPSASVGIRGFGIRIPESNLQFPTIQLPSVIRYRRGAEAHFESARSPQIAGMAAMPSQIVPGGHSIPVTAQAPPQAPPQVPQQVPPQAPPSLPGAPANCVPQSPPASPADLQAYYELMETRRALELYRLELEQLKRSLDPAQPTATDDPNIPPSPALRRISNPGDVNSVPADQWRLPRPRIVEAGYIENEWNADDLVPSRGRLSSAPEDEAPRPSSPVHRRARERQQPRPSSSPNIGFSSIQDDRETESDDAGLGAWKSSLPQERAVNGSAKRANGSSAKRVN
jgi:hypothetical protein